MIASNQATTDAQLNVGRADPNELPVMHRTNSIKLVTMEIPQEGPNKSVKCQFSGQLVAGGDHCSYMRSPQQTTEHYLEVFTSAFHQAP